MGGKTSTTTQSVQIPPEVMERYRAVNTRAEQAATQPFQQYSTDPSAFVAPLTSTQQAAIQNIGATQNIAQPYYQAGAGLTLSGAQGVGPLTQQQIGYYQNPFTQAVAGTTFDALRQQQQQEMQGATANAIRSGAFGGDRAGLVAANLARQQQLGTAQAMAPIFERGYAQALQTAQGQQGVAAQDLQRQLAAGQQIAGLGTGATQTALQAAQGLLGAGTAEQQTQQAGQSALYNQFLQERGYPFQVAQFLANIAMGTGALSGSTTTTQQPVPFFSDEREKTNVQPLGKGLYAYDYIDDVEAAERGERPMPPKRVGPMAQDIEERAPGLVGEVGGHKIVKGLSPESMGGAVLDLEPGEYRSGYAPGGLVSSDDIRAILDAQKAAFAPFAQAGLYGGSPQQGGAGKPGYVPGGLLPVPKLMTAGPAPRQPDSVASQAMATGRDFGLTPRSLYDMGEKGLGALRRSMQTGPSRAAPPAPVSPAAPPPAVLPPVEIPQNYETERPLAYGGLVGYAEGGGVDKDDPMSAYGPQGPGIAIPTEQPDIKPLEPAKPPPPPNSVMSDILGLAKTAASIYSMSDERMKRGMEPVGELYNGLPVYKYRMGDGPTQIGLSAQEASGLHPGAAIADRNGILHLDYDRATRAYGGGLMPRMGYQAGGVPSQYREYVEEASRETGIPVPILAAKIQQEGQWRPDAEGRAGEIGMSQVLPSTARRPGFGVAPVDPEVLRQDPREQILFGARYLAGRGRAAGVEDWSDYSQAARALRAYNGGGDPNYVQNVFRHLPRFGVEGVSAYAGEQPRAAASEAIQGAAGAPAGLGAARVQARGEAAPAEERGLIASLLPTKFGTRTVATPKGEQFGSLGEFLTSRQFIQPLFEGVGAMASSPSLSGWGAALQGLGAASRAYTGLEKEMAGTQTEAEQARSVAAQTSETQAATSRNNVFVRDGVTFINYYDPKTGGYKTIRSYEYFDLPEELKPALSALDRQKLESAAEFDRRRTAGEGVAAAAEKPATTTTTTPPGEVAAAPRADIKLSPDVIASARDEARELQRMQMGPDRNKAIEENLRIATEARKQRDASLRLTGNLNDLAKPLAGLSAGQQIAPGAFSKILSMGAKIINSAADQLNLPEDYRVAAEGSSQYELAQKASRILTEAKAANLDQRAVSALTTLEQGLADPSKQGDTIAEILAAAYVEKQKALEEARFIDLYSRSAGAGITVAKNASSLFRNQSGTRDEDYLRDQAIIKEFLKAKIQEEGPSKGKSLLSFLMQQNRNDPLQKKITPEIINQMYGADIARYFLNK